MLADYHMHTAYSDDSEYPMQDLVADSIARGLNEICITDHVDYGIKRDWDDERGISYRSGGPGEPETMALANVDYPRYASELAALKERFAGQIVLKMGLEFGMQQHTIPQFKKLFSAFPFDFIILSVHQVEDKELWTQAFQRGRSQQEYNLRYYEEILALVQQYTNYSVLGHMDLIKRYDKAGPFPFKNIRPIVSEILKRVIADGKGIEVNTSGQRYGLQDLTPSTDILKLYRELGGSIITLGSDSHKKEQLGAYLVETKERLKQLGFRQFCTFERMKPVFHRLD